MFLVVPRAKSSTYYDKVLNMAYKSIEQAQKKNKGLEKYSTKAKRGWLKAFNSSLAKDGDESKAFAIAYSVANKVDGRKGNDSISDCDCDCDEPCVMHEFEVDIETPYADIEVEVKPRYREVGNIAKNIASLADEIMSYNFNGERNRNAGSLFDSPNPSLADIEKMSNFLSRVKITPHDAAFLSYALNAMDGRVPKSVYGRLYKKAVEIYRENLFEWFSHGLIKRSNRLPGTKVNKTLSDFVLDVPEAILDNRAPIVRRTAAAWRFLNLDLLPAAGIKIARVVKEDAVRSGLWSGVREDSSIKLDFDRAKKVWFIPATYRKWTYENRVRLNRYYNFRWNANLKRWETPQLSQRIKEDFSGHHSGVNKSLMSPPDLDRLTEWYVKTWLPKNIERFSNLFSNILPPKGVKLDYEFKVQRNGNVKVVIRGGISKVSDAIQELRSRYINRQGREPWLEVMDKVIELSRVGNPDKVMQVIDRANNLEHSNGMFMEHFPGNVFSWYGKFLNAKYNAPTAGALAKYIRDSDLRDIVTHLDFAAHYVRQPKIEDEPGYHDMHKKGPEAPANNWRKLRYPYPKGTPSRERNINKDDPRVQKGLRGLRQRGSSVLAFDQWLKVLASDDDMKAFADEVVDEADKWELDDTYKNGFTLDADVGYGSYDDPVVSATLSVRNGKTTLELEAFNDDTDFEAWDKATWRIVPSYSKTREKLVKAVAKRLNKFVDNL